MNATTCTACKALTSVGIQCNHHRRVEPNERTLMQREMSAYMAETGCTPAEAEAHFGVTAGVTVGA